MLDKTIQIEEIENKRKLPEEVKEKMNRKIFINLLLAIGYMLLMITINIIYLNAQVNDFIIITKIFSVFFMFLTVIVLEISYRKESLEVLLFALEMLACSIVIMYIPYTYIHMQENVREILMLSPLFFAIYYVSKSIALDVKFTNDYYNNLSDVKEIVKDDEKTSYLDEDSKKIIKEINEIEKIKKEEKRILKEAKKNQKNSSKKEEKTEEVKKVAKTNKSETTKKASKKETEKKSTKSVAKDKTTSEKKTTKKKNDVK